MSDSTARIRIGTAGWSLPRASWPAFPEEGSHLERYAQRLNAAEINSSFYRPHQRSTYEKWVAAVPADFSFAVKLPKTITHERRLKIGDSEGAALLGTFFEQVNGLDGKLGCLLAQLPPSLAMAKDMAQDFFEALRAIYAGDVALEPRHASWFTDEADAFLKSHRISRVLADPVMFDAGRKPGGDEQMTYVRLHGSPRMYYSAYGRELLAALAVRLQLAAASDARVWCVFDNTASGAAIDDALRLKGLLAS